MITGALKVLGVSPEKLSRLYLLTLSREWRREYNQENDIPPEHPRASTSDDVECLFSVLTHTEMTRLSQPCDKVVTTMSTLTRL